MKLTAYDRNVTVIQRQTWVIERVGWALIALALVAALLGVFGNGPLSEKTLTNPLFSTRFERFARLGRICALTIRTIQPDSGAELEIHLDRNFIDQVDMVQAVPRPIRMESAPKELVVWVANSHPGNPTWITLSYKPRGPGRLRANLQVGAGPPMIVNQWVYP